MARIFLEEMLEDLRFDSLPVNWNAFDVGTFSRTKTLWDYQRRAVENAIKALWKYYNVDGLPKKYKRYWFDDVGKVLASVLAST